MSGGEEGGGGCIVKRKFEDFLLSNAEGINEDSDSEDEDARGHLGGTSSGPDTKRVRDSRIKYSVPVNTVLKWRGKTGVDLEYVLGCGITATDAHIAKFVEVLNQTGKLICILCNQSLSATRKSI